MTTLGCVKSLKSILFLHWSFIYRRDQRMNCVLQRWIEIIYTKHGDFPSGASDKESAAKAGDVRAVALGEGHGNSLQYSCLENPMDRGAYQAIVHKVAKSWTWLKWQHACKVQSSVWHSKGSFCGVIIYFKVMLT